MESSKNFNLFVRLVEGRELRIYFERSLYLKYSETLEKIFQKFENKICCKKELDCGLYICCNKIYNIPEKSKMYAYESLDGPYLFQLLSNVEEFIIEELGLTVFHGASICCREQIVLVLGERKSGKTTLTHYLIEHGWNLIDDDCIYYGDNIVFGMGFPLRLREIIFCKKNIFSKCIDASGEDRYLLLAQNSVVQKEGDIIVIFPQYSKNSNFSVSAISKMTLFTKLLQNVRYSISNAKSLIDATNLMKKMVAGYIITFSNCSDVNLFLKELNQ